MNAILLLCVGLAPIVWLFFAFIHFRLPGHVACPCGLLLAAALALFVIGKAPADVATAALEGAVFALWPILLAVLAAMILYRYSVETGGMETIKKLLTGISRDKRILALILAWGFGGFLEGIAGFGVPVLIVGSILVALGFNPMLAVVVCLVANCISTPFATVGVPVSALAGVTGLDVGVLGANAATQLFLLSLILPFFLVMLVGGGARAIKGIGLITLIAGISFALPLLLTSRFMGPELPALFSSICAIVCVTAANKRFYRDDAYNKRFRIESASSGEAKLPNPGEAKLPNPGEAKLPNPGEAKLPNPGEAPPASVYQACLPFALALITITATSLIAPIRETLGKIRFDTVVYAGEGGNTLSFAPLLSPGILIIISLIIACFLQRVSLAALLRIAGKTVMESRNMIITIITIVAMAKIMDYSGMTDAIAVMLIAVFAVFYPLVAPVIGMLGTFITGSATTSSILFGSLQAGAARAIGVDPAWIASAGLSAAAVGKMISPQSIAIGLRIGGLDGKEGEILRKTLKYALVCTGIICLISYFGTLF